MLQYFRPIISVNILIFNILINYMVWLLSDNKDQANNISTIAIYL